MLSRLIQILVQTNVVIRVAVSGISKAEVPKSIVLSLLFVIDCAPLYGRTAFLLFIFVGLSDCLKKKKKRRRKKKENRIAIQGKRD